MWRLATAELFELNKDERNGETTREKVEALMWAAVALGESLAEASTPAARRSVLTKTPCITHKIIGASEVNSVSAQNGLIVPLSKPFLMFGSH